MIGGKPASKRNFSATRSRTHTSRVIFRHLNLISKIAIDTIITLSTALFQPSSCLPPRVCSVLARKRLVSCLSSLSLSTTPFLELSEANRAEPTATAVAHCKVNILQSPPNSQEDLTGGFFPVRPAKVLLKSMANLSL